MNAAWAQHLAAPSNVETEGDRLIAWHHALAAYGAVSAFAWSHYGFPERFVLNGRVFKTTDGAGFEWPQLEDDKGRATALIAGANFLTGMTVWWNPRTILEELIGPPP